MSRYDAGGTSTRLKRCVRYPAAGGRAPLAGVPLGGSTSSGSQPMLRHWKISWWHGPHAGRRLARFGAAYAGAAVLIYADHLGKIFYT